MTRRDFIKTTAVGATVSFAPKFLAGAPTDMPKRTLGRSGEKLSMLGFGGILVMNEEQKAANEMVAKAFDHGINYFDVAPSYGNAEEILGPAFAPYRQKCFLACKTTERSAQGAQQELEQSLIKLRTDFFDLYQLHAITTAEDVETAFGPAGAMETFLKAKKDGKIRYIGFSAHSELAAHMAMERYDFDTILFPINCFAWFKNGFGKSVLAKAKETNKGILALKGLAHRRFHEGEEKPYPKVWYTPIAEEENELAQKAFSWTYAQGVTAAIPPGQPVFWDRAFRIAAKVTALTDKDIEILKKAAADINVPIFPET